MKYMLIDVTTVEGTALLTIASDMRNAALLGKLYTARGLTIIAPPLEGRGFSKLDKLPLQYLYWNICQVAPPEDYQELLQSCLEKLNAMPVDLTPIGILEREIAHLCPAAVSTDIPSKARVTPSAPDRPKPTSTTGQVWELADATFNKHYESSTTLSQVDWKTLRTEIISTCKNAGINAATASTQYCKWKNQKDRSNS